MSLLFVICRSKDEVHRLVWDILGIMTNFNSVDLRSVNRKENRIVYGLLYRSWIIVFMPLACKGHFGATGSMLDSSSDGWWFEYTVYCKTLIIYNTLLLQGQKLEYIH